MKHLKAIEREKIKKQLRKMEFEQKLLRDEDIFNKIIKLDRFINARDIFTYVSFDNEVDTKKLIQYSIENGKKVYVPKVEKGERRLRVFNIESESQLEIGSYNILEPENGVEVDKKKFDLLFIPGLLFTRDGFRLGRGEGYFDRFLSNVSGYKIGLCYSFQIRENLPAESHDIKVDEVISE